MVALDAIKQSNSRLKAAGTPRVAVFIGGTSGVGHFTLTELVESDAETKIYLIGRPSAAARMKHCILNFKRLHPNAEVIWLEGDISLQADVRRICFELRSKESTIDLLFMSPGTLPFSGRRETIEGLDTSQSLQYFSRIAFIINLLPQLRSSPRGGRIVSVMGGGLERPDIDVEDLELRKTGSFGAIRSQVHLIAMNILMMEKISEGEGNVVFIHAFPGQVYTGNLTADLPPGSPLRWLLRIVAEPLVKLFGISQKESGQRHLFVSTSAMYGGRGVDTKLSQAQNSNGKTGPGLFLVNQYSDAGLNKEALDLLRGNPQSKVYMHTQKVLEPFLL